MKKIEKIQKTSIKHLNNSFSSYFKNSDKMKEEEKMAFKELYQCIAIFSFSISYTFLNTP